MVIESLGDDKSKEAVDNFDSINENQIKPYEKVKKLILNILKSHDLDIKDIALSSDGKYLISCSEVWQKEKSKVFIWLVEKFLEGEREPEAILEGEYRENEKLPIHNWLLCVDTFTTQINNIPWWIVCAGSINGDINIWSGKIDPSSKEWILDDPNMKIVSETDENTENLPRAVYDLKILKNSENDNFQVYFASNNIHTMGIHKTQDNIIKELSISFNSNGNIIKNEFRVIGNLSEWITSMDLNIKKKLLVAGTRDGKILKWDLSSNINNPILIGEHEDSTTCVKIYNDGNKVVSGCLDSTIRIWINNDTNKSNLFQELEGHSESVTSLDIQRDDKYLFSISKDNTIKAWDLEKGNWIRNINVDYFLRKYKKEPFSLKYSKMYLRRIKITPDNRYIFIAMDNIIVILRNFGPIWQFREQIKFIKNIDEKLYTKIYGENLLQIAKKSPENVDSLKTIYEIISKRMKKATIIDLAHKTHEIEGKFVDFSRRELGPLFIPSFIEFEKDVKNQKEYILGVKDNYDSYWNSLRNSYFKLPDLPWKFKLYITTDITENIKEAKFVEVSLPDIKDSVDIIMKDRNQTLIRFLMVLENVPTNFIPLINSINLDVEDDRGDKDNLAFSDFTYSMNFIKVLTKPEDSFKDFRTLVKPDSFFYSFCTFQLEEGYNTEDFANIFIRKISVEYTETLNPLEKSSNIEEENNFFEAFKDNFQFPLIPKIKVQIGKGIASSLGKLIDEYFAKIVIVEFIFSFWGFIEIGIPAIFPGLIIPDIVSNLVAISAIAIIGMIFLMMIIKK